MADNIELSAGSGGSTLATDDIAGVHYQIAKLAHGALDSATIVSTASGLPVQQQGTFTVDLGATDNAVLDAIEADTTTLAGAVDGTEMQVDVVGPLPAGTNNIGDVDVLSFPTSVHAEDFDTGAGTDNTLAFGIAVPASGGAVVVPGDATAGLKVDLGADNDVTVTGTVTANLSATDNAVLDSIDTNTTTIAGAVSGSEMQVDVVSSALPSGAATAANQLPDGHNVTVDNGAGGAAVNIQDGGNSITVDGTVTANAGTGPWPVTDNGGSLTVDNGGTFAVQAAQSGSWTVTANAGTNLNTSALGTSANQSTMITALQLIDNASVNHDAAVVSGVTQVGLDARSTNGTAVASGDATRAQSTLLGKQVVYPYALPGTTWQYAGPTGGITDTADDVIQSAGGAGVRHYLTSLTVVNAHSTVATEVVIKDGSTVIHRGYAAAAGGGYTTTFPTPLRGTAATALNVACITTGSATHVSASGFSAAE